MTFSMAEKVLDRIERMASRKYLPIIGPRRGQILVDSVHRLKPKRILEVGTFIGYSTILMGKELESDAEIITIEIDKEEAEIAERNIREAEIKPNVIVLIGDASDIIPEIDGEFDMVFMDGDKSDYLRHLILVEGKLHKGSLIVADNAGAYAYSMRNYLDYVRNSGKYKSQFMPSDGDGVEVSIKL